MKTVLSERGQVVIPKPLRVRLGLRPGQQLECREVKGRLVLEKANGPADALKSVYGILKLGRSTDELINGLRGSPDVP